MDIAEIPLRVLVLDRDSESARLLVKSLGLAANVVHAIFSQDIEEARAKLVVDDINTIFIDLLAFEIDTSSAFVLEVRKALPSIVFVLFQDQERVEQNREEFFRGKRRRFSHYYRLDKRTPVDSFNDELAATIRLCQSDLSWGLPEESLRKLIAQGTPKESRPEGAQLARGQKSSVRENTVFVSHRFSEADENLVSGLLRHLGDTKFEVITGKLATGYISRAVIERIKDSEFFLCLLTKADEKVDGTYTASAWLHQELGAAIAFGKPVVLMVEQGVTDLGGLQGDVQKIHFAERGFMNAALDAVVVLREYAGRQASKTFKRCTE